MSSDFYLRAQTLYEEFQKKELNYLNAERKLSHCYMGKSRDLNVPFQEYLQKLHEREKKNEEIYQNIVKQMNKLDQHTDLLCSKMEKLGVFRSIQVSQNFNDANYAFTSRCIPQNTIQNINTEHIVSHFESNNLKSSALKSTFTQTESDICCDNCSNLISVSPQPSQILDSTCSTIDILSVSKEEPQVINSSRIWDDSVSLLNENASDPQFTPSAVNDEHFFLDAHDKKKYVNKSSENGLQTNEKYDGKFPNSRKLLKEKEPILQSNAISCTEDALKMSTNKEIINELQSKTVESKINVKDSVQGNAADSVNNEFDFLESDNAHLVSKTHSQNSSKNNEVPSNQVDKNKDPAASLDMNPSKSSMKFKNGKNNFQSNKEEETCDNRSETSGSVSVARSPAISMSDSDSIYEKGSYATSAAYQSLLGNNIVLSMNNKVSESDSEDEVEKTLASTVKKSNMKPKSSAQPMKNRTSPETVDYKSAIDKPKPVSANKPQAKLTKRTKKMLGIDTSSSSEIDVVVKSSENRKDEDSDEFDFFD